MGHDVIDQRSLAMAKIIANRILENPGLLNAAKKNLDRWLVTCAPNSRATLMEWKAILESGVGSTIEVLGGQDERSTRLRQSSPFAGEEFITRAERSDLILRFSAQKTV